MAQALVRNATSCFGIASMVAWIGPLADGSDTRYSAREHALFYYANPNGEYMKVAQSGSSGILYGGGTVGGQWESAYGGAASMSSWHPGEWHHIAFTFSAAGNSMRFYVDGVLTADTNEKHYTPPGWGGDRFYLGSTPGGTQAAYNPWTASYWRAIDLVTTSGRSWLHRTLAYSRGPWESPQSRLALRLSSVSEPRLRRV